MKTSLLTALRGGLILAAAACLMSWGQPAVWAQTPTATPGLRGAPAAGARAATTATSRTTQTASKPTSGSQAAWPADAPETFKVQFELSNGTVVAQFTKSWAPLGVQRMYDLVRAKYFDGARFFRVVPNFVVQFGLAADPNVTAQWRDKNLTDEPVKQGNTPGRICFAKAGPNTRTTQLFINTGNNAASLDPQDFSAIGEVIQGMDVVQKINPQYGQSPDQGRITAQGNAYLNASFPKLDYIKKATLVK